MGTLALVLLIVWAVGILLSAWGTVILLKEDSDASDKTWRMYEQAPTLTLISLTVLTVFWPATLLFNIVVGSTKGNTK